MAISENRYFYYFNGEKLDAVRKGKWKYVFAHKGQVVIEPGKDGEKGKTDWGVKSPEALYDLKNDLGERDNRIDEYPDIALAHKKAGEIFDKTLKSEVRPIGLDETNP